MCYLQVLFSLAVQRCVVHCTHLGATQILSQILLHVALLARGLSAVLWAYSSLCLLSPKPLCHGSNQQEGSLAEMMPCPFLQLRLFFPASSSNSVLDDSVLLQFPPQNAPAAFLRYSGFVIAFCLRQLRVGSNIFPLLRRRWQPPRFPYLVGPGRPLRM